MQGTRTESQSLRGCLKSPFNCDFIRQVTERLSDQARVEHALDRSEERVEIQTADARCRERHGLERSILNIESDASS